MKRILGFLACLLFATVAYAQDVDFGAFDDSPNLLTPTGPATRGATPPRGAAPVAPPDRLVRLRDALVKAGTPLTKEQEGALNKVIEAEIPIMRKTLQTHGQQMMAARGGSATPPTPGAPPAGAGAPAATTPAPATPPPASPPAGQSAPPRGASPPGAPNPALLAAIMAARGAPPSSRVPADVLDALEVEMREMNDALFLKIASSSSLNPMQQSVLTKMARAQVRARGGYEALRIAMEDAGSPFTAEQTPKVQALFEDQKTARAVLAKESQGTPDPEKLKQLDRETLTKVIGLLTPAQRTALLAVLKAQQ